MKIKESDLFPYLRDYFLQDPKNEIFTEVAECGGPRPDIVVRNGAVITVVEMKTSLSMKLLEQAINWRYRCNYVYVAVPKIKKQNGFALKILNDYGIGLLEIDISNADFIKKQSEKYDLEKELGKNFRAWHVRKNYNTKAKLFRNKDKSYGFVMNWNKALKDRYKYENNVNGGNKGGGYNTEYSEMIDKIRKFIEVDNSNKWTSVEEILDNVEESRFNSCSPKSRTYNALKNNSIFESKIINRRVHFRVKENDKNE